MEQNNIEKKKLIIFILVAYAFSYLMGILMWFGSSKGYDISVFPTAQMMYPACGVILGMLMTNHGEKKLPKAFFGTILATTGILVIIALISVIHPLDNLDIQGTSISVYNLASQYILIIAGIVALILLIVSGKEKRAAAGLTRKNWKTAAFIIVVFLLIYLARTVVATGFSGIVQGVGLDNTAEWFKIFQNPMVWINIIVLPINYCLLFVAFFGEEYGWRYYLQPIMQNKFGLRLGVVLLGVVWGLWHLPLDLFYYTKDYGVQMIFSQQITCITLGIFFGYAYMKTNNIWVPVCLHFLNNNLVPIITATFTADVLENQVMHWSDLPVALVLNGLCFGFFLLADVYKKKDTAAENQEEDTTSEAV